MGSSAHLEQWGAAVKPTRVEYITPGAWVDEEQPLALPVRHTPTFVAPEPRRPAPVDPPAWIPPAQPVDVAPALMAIDGAQEHTSAMDRAQALRVRLLPFVLLWGLLGLVVGVVVLLVAQNAPGAALVALLVFVALTSITYHRLNRTDYEYSREGTEQLKVVTAADLARLQLEQNHELRRTALEAYLRTLERHDRQ